MGRLAAKARIVLGFSLEKILEVVGKYVDCCSVDPDNFVCGIKGGFGMCHMFTLVCKGKGWGL